MATGESRPDPDLLLRQLQAEETRARRGRLKVFLGYSSGVGKTFTMLDEGRRRRERNGEDVVVGAVQEKRPPEADAILARLEVIPLRQIEGQSCVDVAALLRRRPRVCLIDGLAYENARECGHEHRWQDVNELLEAGISVITTINLQYIAEYQDRVAAITGKRPNVTVPLSFIQAADDIEIVDAPAAEAVQHAGVDAAGSAAKRERQLAALREFALLAAADVVDRQLEAYLEQHGVQSQWGTQERILVCVTARSDASRMIASGKRNGDRLHGELYVVYVEQPELTQVDRATLARNLSLAREAGARVEVLPQGDPVDAILKFAAERGITQIFIGHTGRRGWWTRLLGGPVDRLIRRAEGIDVQVFPH